MVEELWSSKELGEYLKCSPRHAVERFACLPDFPKPIRLPSAGKTAHPRWDANKVRAWVEKYQVAA